MITEDEYRDKVNIDITSENLPKLENFLKINKDTIKSGLEYIEGNYFKLGFEDGLKKIGYKLDIVPGERLNEYKTDPTETSSENMIIRVTQLYLDRNPWFTRFEDEFGWSYHEFVHAIIFSGNLPKEYLEICSPFGYPFTTDEIYTFGF